MSAKKKVAAVLSAVGAALSLVVVPLLNDAPPQWEAALAALSAAVALLFVKPKEAPKE